MDAIKWSRFSKNDWAAFAGAQKFTSGGNPFIAKIKVDGKLAIALLDAEGIEIVLSADDDQNGNSFMHEADVETLACLTTDMTSDELNRLGFSFMEV